MPKIFLYVSDNGDGSHSISYYRSQEDRNKRRDYDHQKYWVIDGACSYTIDTDNIRWQEPPEDEYEDKIKDTG